MQSSRHPWPPIGERAIYVQQQKGRPARVISALLAAAAAAAAALRKYMESFSAAIIPRILQEPSRYSKIYTHRPRCPATCAPVRRRGATMASLSGFCCPGTARRLCGEGNFGGSSLKAAAARKTLRFELKPPAGHRGSSIRLSPCSPGSSLSLSRSAFRRLNISLARATCSPARARALSAGARSLSLSH